MGRQCLIYKQEEEKELYVRFDGRAGVAVMDLAERVECHVPLSILNEIQDRVLQALLRRPV